MEPPVDSDGGRLLEPGALDRLRAHLENQASMLRRHGHEGFDLGAGGFEDPVPSDGPDRDLGLWGRFLFDDDLWRA